MDHQLQDTRTPVAAVTGFSTTNAFQPQVVRSVAVPQRDVAQDLQRQDDTKTMHNPGVKLVIVSNSNHVQISRRTKHSSIKIVIPMHV